MRKIILIYLAVLFTGLFALSGSIGVDSSDTRCIVLTNELGQINEGGLIEQLITAGHGSKNLYQILQLLADQPESGIPANFVTEVASSPAGSDVFTYALNNFSDASNNPIVICGDGVLLVASIYGKNYPGTTGYVTNTVSYSGIGETRITLATSPVY